MSFCYFAFFRFPGDPADRKVSDADVAAIHSMLSKLPSLQRGLVHLPAPRSTRCRRSTRPCTCATGTG